MTMPNYRLRAEDLIDRAPAMENAERAALHLQAAIALALLDTASQVSDLVREVANLRDTLERGQP